MKNKSIMESYFKTSASIADKMRQLLLLMKEMNNAAALESSKEGEEIYELTGRSNLSGT